MINDDTVADGACYTICDLPRVHTDITFNKRDIKQKQKVIQGVQFRLYGTSDYGNAVNEYAVSDENGIVTFENIELGTYTLKEVSVNPGYVLDTTEFAVRIDENANFEIVGANRELDGTFTIYNEPRHSFTIQKEGYIEVGGSYLPVEGAVFRLTGTSDLGSAVDMTETTKKNGQTEFSRLEAGRYILREISAPEGYSLNTNVFVVKITDDDIITISGSERNTSGNFVIKDKEDGSVTITKKWADNETNETRTAAPVIRLGVSDDSVDAYFANKGVDSLLTQFDTLDNIRGFMHFNGTDDEAAQKIGLYTTQRLDDGSTKGKIYGWYESNYVYWWSDAPNVYLTDKSKNIWRGLTSATYIDASGINTSLMTDMSEMFMYCYNLQELDISTFNTSNVTDMSRMFLQCGDGLELDLRHFVTSKVTDMSEMFLEAGGITLLDVSSFDTSNVTDMHDMFNGQYGITALDVSGFVTSKVTDMSGMFFLCQNVPVIDVSGFDTANVTNMASMFDACQSLKSIDLRSFDMSKVTSVYSMFSSCSELTEIDLSGFNCPLVTDLGDMFYYCQKLKSVNMRGFDTSGVTSMNRMFYFCSALESIDLSPLNTSSLTDMTNMFWYCTKLQSAVLRGCDLSHVTKMTDLFYRCTSLLSIDLRDLDLSSLTDMSLCFGDCYALKSVNMSGILTPNVTNISGMFRSCKELTSVDLRAMNTSNVTNMSDLFSGCSKLTSIDLRGVDTSKVTDMSYMFGSCSKLTSLNLTGIDTSNVTSMARMFSNCSSIKTIPLTALNTSSITSIAGMFSYCSALTSVDLSTFNTSKVKDMTYLFCGCSNLSAIPLGTFDTALVHDMSYMFSGCSNLSAIPLGTFDTSLVYDMSYMFSGCSKLTSLDLSTFDTHNLSTAKYMFNNCTKLVKIFASGLWDNTNLWNAYGMCYNCTALNSDGAATRYSSSDNSIAYQLARIYTHYQEGYLRAAPGYTPPPPPPTPESQPISDEDAEYFRGNSSLFGTFRAKYLIKKIKRYTGDLESIQDKIDSGTAKRFDDESTGKVIYAWFISNTNEAYWWTDASKVYITDKSKDIFYNLQACTEIDLDIIDTSKLTDMSKMFYKCSAIKELDLSGFDTSNATDMSSMFYNCSALKELDLSSFDTSKVKNTESMFYNCGALTELDLTGFDTSLVTNMNSMFYSCKKLTRIALDKNKFDTSRVTDMADMFYYCEKLTALDPSGFNTQNVTTMKNMFYYCSLLPSIDLSSFDTSNVTDMSYMFYQCSKAELIDVSSFDTSKVTEMSRMFMGCFNVAVLDVSDFDTSHVESFVDLFYGCRSVKNLDVSGFETSGVTSMSWMFGGCSSLMSVDVTGFDTSKVTSMSFMFYNCLALKEIIGLGNFDTSKVIYMQSMFESCSSLEQIDLNGFDTSSVISMDNMFKRCSTLVTLDISRFNTSKVTDMGAMFSICTNLKELDVSGLDTSRATDISAMFYGCENLTFLDVSGFDTSRATDIGYMFYGCKKLRNIDVSGFDTSNVTYAGYMFQDCSSLAEIDVSRFDTRKFISLSGMFSGCTALKEIDLSRFDTSGVSSFSETFKGCESLTEIDLSNFDMRSLEYNTSYSSPDTMKWLFKDCINLKTIYVGELWTKSGMRAYANEMFVNCYSIVGQNGTTYYYKYNNNGGGMTVVDTPQKEGYLTYKKAVVRVKEIASSEDSAMCTLEKTNDKTWSYTFTGLDTNLQYFAWEDELENYSSLNMGMENYLAVKSGSAVITNKTTRELPETGTLSVGKNVLNKDGTETLDPTDSVRTFLFTVTLKDADDNALSGDLLLDAELPDRTAGTLLFTDGQASFRLADDEFMVIKDIPSGYHYFITEADEEDFDTTITKGSAEGTIITNTDSVIVFTNQKRYDEQNEDVTFTVRKMVTGYGIDPDEKFYFAIDFSGLRNSCNYSVTVDGEIRKMFTSNSTGGGFAEFYLMADETASITVPKDTSYCITESAGAFVSSYSITDAAGLDLIVKSSESNTEKNKALSTKIETADEGEQIAVVFTNIKSTKQKLTLNKELKYTAETNQDLFDFTIVISELPADCVLRSSFGDLAADDEGVVTAELRLSGGDTIVIYDIPVGAKYNITEGKSSYDPAFVIMYGDTEVAKSSYVRAGNPLSTGDRAIELYKDPEITFTNTKNSHTVTVTKLVDMTNGVMNENEYGNEGFDFKITLSGFSTTSIYRMKYSSIIIEFTKADTTGSIQTTLGDVLGLSKEEADAYATGGEFTVTLHHGDSVKLMNLPSFSYFNVEEQAARNYIASYSISSDPLSVLQAHPASNNKPETPLSLDTAEYINYNDRDIEFVFTNKFEFQPYTLPASGFDDMRPAYIALFILMAVCAMGYVYSARKGSR